MKSVDKFIVTCLCCGCSSVSVYVYNKKLIFECICGEMYYDDGDQL